MYRYDVIFYFTYINKPSEASADGEVTTVLGYVQRGGAPTPEDRLLAARLGAYAVDLLKQGVSGVCVGVIDNKLQNTPIEEALEMKNVPSEELHNLVQKLN